MSGGWGGSNEAALRHLVRCVATAPDVTTLVGRYMDGAREVFGAFATGFYLLGDDACPAEIHVGGLPDRFITLYEQHGREVDPLFGALLERHRPIDETCLFADTTTWIGQPLFQRCSAPYDVGHYLLGPIVAGGRLVGTMNFGRRLRAPPFRIEERMTLASLSAHVSASIAALRSRRVDPERAAACTKLTRRELQIARRVADGLTNREIASELWIGVDAVKQALKRIFGKTGVSSRAALTARLFDLDVLERSPPARLAASNE